MYTTKEQSHFKFTLYKLTHFYRKYLNANENWGVLHEDRVNESCYEKVFSLDFNDKISFLRFLRNRYEKDNSIIFYTTLGKAIKGDKSNFSNYVAVISGNTTEEKVSFKLREPKKIRKNYSKKKRTYTDYYLKAYHQFARELKKKKMNDDEIKITNMYE